MIPRTSQLSQNRAAASLSKMRWFSETTPTGIRKFAQNPALSSLASKPKLPRQVCAQPRNSTLQPDWVMMPAKTHQNYNSSIYNRYLHDDPILGGETYPLRGWEEGAGGYALHLLLPAPSRRVLHSVFSASQETPTMTQRQISHRIDFSAPPGVGHVLMREGQRYELVNQKPHIRKDGQPTTLLVWRSHCADCGSAFEIMTGLISNRGINRRWPKHHRPGRAVTVAGCVRRQQFVRHRRSRGKPHA